MIPWFQLSSVNIGFLKMNIWGIFVSIGLLSGMVISYFEAKKRKLEAHVIFDLAFWIIFLAIIGGRLLYVMEHLNIYFPAPLNILKLWQGGMSIYGGFIGAIMAAIFYFKKHKIDFWKYADAVIFGLPFGLFIGRIGCFLIHDHPGTKTDFFLGVGYPDGVRHDLGLYDSILGLAIFLIFLFFSRRQRFTGFYVAIFAILYGAVRFFLDFLRIGNELGADPRYFGLTLAQYLSFLTLIIGLFIFYGLRKIITKDNDLITKT